MIGKQNRWQGMLFMTGSLEELIPRDHILKRVYKVLNLSWLHKEASDCYCDSNGRPGIDPEAAVRQMLAGFFQGIVYDRKSCQLSKRCLPPTSKVRTVCIVDGYEALLRARRKKLRWDTRHWYNRHRWRVEGVHGEAKTQDGLRQAVRRGLMNVAIQVYLTAAMMNLKRLATALLPYFWLIRSYILCIKREFEKRGDLQKVFWGYDHGEINIIVVA